MHYLIIYKKYNGNLIYRVRHTKPRTSIGKTTSMGWLVVDIKQMTNGKLYSTYDFSCLIEKRIALRDAIVKVFNKKNIKELLIIAMMLYIIFVKLK